MKKIAFLILLISPITLWAQIDIPVDLLTGKPVVSLPITSLSVGNVLAGVMVAYNGDGYRVGDMEGSAGMGWTLLSSGQIYRELRGLPDDFDLTTDARKGWLNGTRGVSVNSFAPSADISCTDWANLNNLIAGDTEPDMFYVNAPGLNCSFIFDQNKNIQILQQQNLKVSYTRNASLTLSSFTVINDQGIKYTFSASYPITRQALKYKNANVTHFTRNYNYYSSKLSFIPSWDLTEIRGVNNEIISFNYIDADGAAVNKTYFKKVNSAFTGIDTLYYFADQSRGKNISSITTLSQTITFEWSNQIISKVKIQDLNIGNSKEFLFLYGKVRNTTESKFTGSFESQKEIRNFLTEIQVITNCKPLPSFRFEYYGVDLISETTDLPFKKKYPQDLWGYFNNATISNVNTALIPQIYQNASAIDGERFRIAPQIGWASIGSSTTRNVNPLTINYGALKWIRYPTGGFAEVIYEPATYYDATTNSDVMGGGLRVASVNISSGQVRNYEYKQANGVSSGKWITKPSFAFLDGTSVVVTPDNLSQESQLLYERVSIIKTGRGKTVYTHVLPAMYNVTTYGGTDWKATKTKIARYQEPVSPYYCEPIGNLTSDNYSYPFAPNTNYDSERGLLSTIEEFNQTGQRVSVVANNYLRLGTAIRVKGIRHEQINGLNYIYGQYEILTNIRKAILNSTTNSYDSADQTKIIQSTTAYTYNAKGYPAEASSTNSDGAVYTSGNKYSCDYTVTTPSGLQPTLIKQMNDLNILSAPIESYNKVNTSFTKAGLLLYDNAITGLPYVKQKLAYSGTGAFVLSTVTGSPQTFTYENAKYKVEQTYEDYNSITGLPITTSDYRKNVSSILYGFAQSPAVVLNNARVKETMFADFEHTSSSHVGTLANFVTTESWSGRKSYQWNGAALVKNSIIKGLGTFYLFTCWVKATTATNITVTAQVYNGSAWVPYAMTYPSTSSGQWKLLETKINMTSIPATFNFQMTSSASVFLDDVSFFPENADYVRSTFDPLVGKTSTSTSLNQYSFTDYDQLGRQQYLRNTDKHILQSYEYRYQEEKAPKPNSSYSCTSGCDLKVGAPVTFTATANCLTPVSYVWKIDGVVVGTNSSTLTYTFTSNKKYTVELTVSNPTYGSTTTSLLWKINPQLLVINLTVDNTGNILQCTDAGTRTYTATLTGGCLNQPEYKWSYMLANGVWVTDLNGSSPAHPGMYTFSFNRLYLGLQAFYVKCEVLDKCPTEVPDEYDLSQVESTIYIGFTAQTQCQ